MSLSPETFESTDITQAIVQVDADPRVTRQLRPLLVGLLAATPGVPTVGIVAAGTTQGTATQLVSAYNHIGTTPLNSGVVLLGSLSFQQAFNGGANSVNVYPPVGAQINSGGVNVAVSITAVAGSATFIQVSPGQWSAF